MIANRVEKIIDLVSSEYNSSVLIVFNRLERIESTLEIRFKVCYDYSVNSKVGDNAVIFTNKQINDLNYLYNKFKDITNSYILKQYEPI